MRSLLVAVILLASTAARADADTQDHRWDAGAKTALAGGIVFTTVYSTTALATGIGDSLCGLGERASSCASENLHGNLVIPLVGGFLPGRDDASRSVGIASSVLQITAVGVMVAGLAVHHWRVHDRRVAAR
jgi:hypothetical protein